MSGITISIEDQIDDNLTGIKCIYKEGNKLIYENTVGGDRKQCEISADRFPEMKEGTAPIILRNENGNLWIRINNGNTHLAVFDRQDQNIQGYSSGSVNNSNGDNNAKKDWIKLPFGTEGDIDYDNKYTLEINHAVEITVNFGFEVENENEVEEPSELVQDIRDSARMSKNERDALANVGEHTNYDPTPDSICSKVILSMDNVKDVYDSLNDRPDRILNTEEGEYRTHDIADKFRLLDECSDYGRMKKYAMKLPKDGNIRAAAITHIVSQIIKRSNTDKSKPLSTVYKALMTFEDSDRYYHNNGNLKTISHLKDQINRINEATGVIQSEGKLSWIDLPKVLNIEDRILDIIHRADAPDKVADMNQDKNTYQGSNSYTNTNKSNNKDKDNKTQIDRRMVKDISNRVGNADELKHVLDEKEWTIKDADDQKFERAIDDITDIGSQKLEPLGTKIRDRVPEFKYLRRLANTMVVSEVADKYNVVDSQNMINRYEKYAQGIGKDPDKIEIFGTPNNSLGDIIRILKRDMDADELKITALKTSFNDLRSIDMYENDNREQKETNNRFGTQESSLEADETEDESSRVDDISMADKYSLVNRELDQHIKSLVNRSESQRFKNTDLTVGDFVDDLKDLAIDNERNQMFDEIINNIHNKYSEYPREAQYVIYSYAIANGINRSANKKNAKEGKVNRIIKAMPSRYESEIKLDQIHTAIDSVNDDEIEMSSDIDGIIRESIEQNEELVDENIADTGGQNVIEQNDEINSLFNNITAEDEEDSDEVVIDDIEKQTLNRLLSQSSIREMKNEFERLMNRKYDFDELSDIEIGGILAEEFFHKLNSDADIINPSSTAVKSEYPEMLSQLMITVEVSKRIELGGDIGDIAKDLDQYGSQLRDNEIECKIGNLRNLMNANRTSEGTNDILLNVGNQEKTPKIVRDQIDKLDNIETGDFEFDQVSDEIEVDKPDEDEVSQEPEAEVEWNI